MGHGLNEIIAIIHELSAMPYFSVVGMSSLIGQLTNYSSLVFFFCHRGWYGWIQVGVLTAQELSGQLTGSFFLNYFFFRKYFFSRFLSSGLVWMIVFFLSPWLAWMMSSWCADSTGAVDSWHRAFFDLGPPQCCWSVHLFPFPQRKLTKALNLGLFKSLHRHYLSLP